MDRIRHLFGVRKESTTDEPQRQQQSDPHSLHPGLSRHSDQTEAVGTSQQVNTLKQDTGLKTALSNVENLLRKVVPLREGDCLECKLIGSTGCLAGVTYVLYYRNKLKYKYLGYQQTLWNITTFTFATFLAGLGVCRFFDIGRPIKSNQSQVTVAESDDAENKSNSNVT